MSGFARMASIIAGHAANPVTCRPSTTNLPVSSSVGALMTVCNRLTYDGRRVPESILKTRNSKNSALPAQNATTHSHSATIVDYYLALLRRWGPQNWWPAQSRFEVIVGAYLTQNTNWLNVEKALINLRKARALSPEA